MLKAFYIIVIVISVILLMVLYFTNIVYLGNLQMFLWSQNNRISVAAWLALIIFISMLLWASIILLLKSLVNSKPKDFDEFDL